MDPPYRYANVPHSFRSKAVSGLGISPWPLQYPVTRSATHPNIACLPFHLSAFVVGPHPTLYIAGYSAAQSLTALSNTDTILRGAERCCKAPREGANAEAEAKIARIASRFDMASNKSKLLWVEGKVAIVRFDGTAATAMRLFWDRRSCDKGNPSLRLFLRTCSGYSSFIHFLVL